MCCAMGYNSSNNEKNLARIPSSEICCLANCHLYRNVLCNAFMAAQNEKNLQKFAFLPSAVSDNSPEMDEGNLKPATVG